LYTLFLKYPCISSDAAFVPVGEGKCRDAEGKLNFNWSGKWVDDALHTLSDCQETCKEYSLKSGSVCVGIHYTQNPPPPWYETCALYLNWATTVVPVETSSGAADSGMCYQYVAAPTIPDPTPASVRVFDRELLFLFS